MEHKVILTKSFRGDLKNLLDKGQKKIAQAVRAAITEAGISGEIASLPRTKHGESRLKNVEKYDLPEAYRLIVQLVDGAQKTRAFLFVGNHADSDHWLDSHKNYAWIKNANDGTLNFVLVTDSSVKRYIPADRMNFESNDLSDKPLLFALTDAEWETIKVSTTTRTYAGKISADAFEEDASSIFEYLDKIAGYEKAGLLFDLMWHAHKREWEELHRRVSMLAGNTKISNDESTAIAMLSPENSDSFITFDDENLISTFFEKNTLAEWMLFLHPEQKKVADRDFKGAARLRGVSGSGKTCVLIHRARYLAKKYQQKILVVTLTDSLRRLLDRLAGDLCGVEHSFIVTKTMSALAKDIVHDLHPRKSFYYPLTPEKQSDIIGDTASYIRGHAEFAQTPLASMPALVLNGFLRDEISYVRGRLRKQDYEKYLDAAQFQRRGRGVPLSSTGRRVVLAGLEFYEKTLCSANLLDHEGIVGLAIELLENNVVSSGFRCVLADEVQDLSELDIALLGKLKSPNEEHISQAENGLFLAGDGAQSIYKRGFVLRRLGIDIAGRSFILRKNYRNTHEILKAAFGLVSQYEFSDVDEENVCRPSEPDFAKRHGVRPMLVRCGSTTEEATFVARQIKSLIDMGQTPGQICIISPSGKTRDEVKSALDSLQLCYSELRQDVDYESNNIKISTIESAKGHEFGSVYIAGLVEGVIPRYGVTDDEIPREAARLYVAMTRARDTLTMTYASSPNPASRFLPAIQSDCNEAYCKNGELRPVKI